MCVLSQYVSLIVKNNPSLINCSLCVRHTAPIFNANGHFFFTAVCCKIDILEIQRVAKMPAAFCRVPATCLDTLMQFAFWPSVRKVAFKELKKHIQVHTAAKDRTSIAVLVLALLFWGNALASVPCATQRVCAPSILMMPFVCGCRGSLLKSLLAFIEPGFYEQFGT